MAFAGLSKITNIEEVKNVFTYLMLERHSIIHLDDDFVTFYGKED